MTSTFHKETLLLLHLSTDRDLSYRAASFTGTIYHHCDINLCHTSASLQFCNIFVNISVIIQYKKSLNVLWIPRLIKTKKL